MMKFAALLALSLLVSQVSAHGYVQEITLGKTTYTGWIPSTDNAQDPPPSRIIRKVPGIGPVLDVDLIDLQCNGSPTFSTAPAALVGEIAAGDTIRFNWTAWPANHAGPVLTYLARAPKDTDITKWIPGKEAVWFKIDHFGKNADGKWAAADLLVAANSIYSVKIPKNLLPGQYIIRHEIVDLHGAATYPGIQFFPSCAQIKVTGYGRAFPTDFVSIPGVYTPTTTGIVWDIADGAPYPLPGPAVWTGHH